MYYLYLNALLLVSYQIFHDNKYKCRKRHVRNEQNCVIYMMMLVGTESNLKVLTMFMFELLPYGLAFEK